MEFLESLVPTFPPSLSHVVLYSALGFIFILWLWKALLMQPSGTYWTLIKAYAVSQICSEWLMLKRRRRYKDEMAKKGVPHEISVVLDVADPHSYVLVKALRKWVYEVVRRSARIPNPTEPKPLPDARTKGTSSLHGN